MANDAKNKAIHASVKFNDKTENYDVRCATCGKSLGSFAGADHAREAYAEHKETTHQNRNTSDGYMASGTKKPMEGAPPLKDANGKRNWEVTKDGQPRRGTPKHPTTSGPK